MCDSEREVCVYCEQEYDPELCPTLAGCCVSCYDRMLLLAEEMEKDISDGYAVGEGLVRRGGVR